MKRESSRRSACMGSHREKGLKLQRGDKARLAELMRRGKMSVRAFKRGRVLQMLSEGATCAAAADAAGVAVSTAEYIKARYRQRGLEGTLTEAARGRREPVFNEKQEQQLVAILCGPSPSGRARWTIRTAAEAAVERGIVPKVGRETVRVVMHNHALKPWREKDVVRAGPDAGIHRADGGRAGAVCAPSGPKETSGGIGRETGSTAGE